jgi:hypothetical protein
MIEYRYEVYSFHKKKRNKKGKMKYCDYEDFPSAMSCYKEYKEEMNTLVAKYDMEDWFLVLSRTYIKGNTRHHTNIKYEGTI